MENILESKTSSVKENGKTTYTIRESYDNNESKELRVREAENGFIISIEHSYYEGEGEKRNWKCDTKEYISKDNPLDNIKTKEEKKKETTTKDIVDSISGFLSSFSTKLMI